jgi:YebC/PmpR family DNA-binding regulatory protein
MSGHSKWSTIKRQKGINDAKRGSVFTRMGNQIAIAARSGTDPKTNSSLALIIEKAKAVNMPLANIQRAIDRVSDKNAAVLQELVYEGYGPGGVAIIVECATDNINRTYPEVRTAFTKNGGSIAEKGSVAFQFERKGLIRVAASGEEAFLQLIEFGAEDVVEEDGETVVYTEPKDLGKVRDAILSAGKQVKDAELIYKPINLMNITDDQTSEKVYKLLEALEDLDDVVSTYTNMA